MNKFNGEPFNVTATHATAAVATKAAAANKRHILTDVAVSSDKAGAILLIKNGTTTIWQLQIGASFHSHKFETPLEAGVNALISAEIDGTAACKANISGVTISIT